MSDATVQTTALSLMGKLRGLLAAQGPEPGERTPPRGLARLLRRNPTDAERLLWDALTKDKRFAGQGYKLTSLLRTIALSPAFSEVREAKPAEPQKTASARQRLSQPHPGRHLRSPSQNHSGRI